MTDAVFEVAVEGYLRDEGAVGDVEGDEGGLTKWGFALRKNPDLTRESLLAMTRQEAKARYLYKWWIPFGFGRLGQVSPLVAIKLFDVAPNIGGNMAIRVLQRALRACARPVVEDGRIGPETLDAVRAVGRDPLFAALRSEIAGHYRLVAQSEPTDEKFLEGWLRRAYA